MTTINIRAREINEIEARNKRALDYIARKTAEDRLTRLNRITKAQDVLLALAVATAITIAGYALRHIIADFVFRSL